MFRGLHLFSYLAPVPLAIVVLILGVLFTLFPPSTYSELIGEQDLMYLNIPTLAYMFLCVGAFVCGAWFIRRLSPRQPKVISLTPRRWSAHYLAIMPLLILSCLASLVVIRTYLSALSLGTIIDSLKGGSSVVVAASNFKEDVAGSGTGWVSAFATACCAWGLWLWLQKVGSKSRQLTLGIVLLATIILQYASGILTLTRTPLLQLTIVLLLVWLLNLNSRGKLNVKRSGLIFIISVIAFIGLFSAVEQTRSGTNSGQNTSLQSFVGYFPGSYNRLSAIMSGQLKIPNQGSSYYLLNGIWLFPGSQALGFLEGGRSLGLDLPRDSYSNWVEGFQTVRNAGLNSGLTWTTAYGSLYAEIGWWGIAFFCLYGIASESFWRRFQAGRVEGIIIYPIFIVSQLQWHATLYIVRRETLVSFAVFFLIVTIYNLWLHQSERHEKVKSIEF